MVDYMWNTYRWEKIFTLCTLPHFPPYDPRVLNFFESTIKNITTVCLHIEVSDDENPEKIHNLSEDVELKIGKEINGTAVIHVDPTNKNHEQYSEIESAIQKIVSEDSRIISHHDLRIVGSDKKACNFFWHSTRW